MSGPVRRVVVVVPVHDEEALLPACLQALVRARDHLLVRRPDVEVGVVVVLDDCGDGSAAVAARFDVCALDVRERAVGAARAAGIDAALAARSTEPAATWIACTDGDSVVPDTWLTAQVELAEGGADVVVGTVRPDPRDLAEHQLAAWQATRVPGRANGHVHGANLGVRADAYLRAGGFTPVDEHEDVLLVERLRRDPCVTVVATDVTDVLTSGRTEGRSPGGYAGYLLSRFPP
ncbi:glycosyltransferase [Cellulomonas sp. JH27-2]|uniref:glycosyltransferase n=1 Tax=Cellulomonas sp. JH27-2 TaxID=2774139 RepID=UPI00177E86FC|nr:glycosyltransferase [Cellulomonas sp. JH27-2]